MKLHDGYEEPTIQAVQKIIELEIGKPIIEWLTELRQAGVIKSWEMVDDTGKKFLIEFN